MTIYFDVVSQNLMYLQFLSMALSMEAAELEHCSQSWCVTNGALSQWLIWSRCLSGICGRAFQHRLLLLTQSSDGSARYACKWNAVWLLQRQVHVINCVLSQHCLELHVAFYYLLQTLWYTYISRCRAFSFFWYSLLQLCQERIKYFQERRI